MYCIPYISHDKKKNPDSSDLDIIISVSTMKIIFDTDVMHDIP